MALNYRKIMSFVIIFALALVTGISVGQIYVGTLETNPEISANESDLRDSDTVISALLERTVGKTPADGFTGVELYEIAEHYLAENDFYKVMTGLVKAVVVTQNMRGEKLKTEGKFVYNKFSPSNSSVAPAIHSQIRVDLNNKVNDKIEGIQVNKDVNILNPDDDPKNGYRFTYNESDFTSLTNDEYVKTFNTQPTSYLPYIISSKTCPASKVSNVTKNGDDYSFEITLSGDYLSFAALYYSYEIRYSSGFEDLPKWVSLTMTVTVDSSFRFKTIHYEEKYKMKAPVIGYTDVIDDFFDVFQYDNLPSYQSICSGEVR